MILYSIWSIFWHSVSLSSGRLSGKSSFWYSILHIFWHTFCHSIWLPAFYLVYILAFYLAYILAFYVAFFLAYILAFYVAFYVAYILAVYLAYILAVFLVYILAFHLAAEVQRCPLSSEGPRLRSSGAHWPWKVPGWGPAVPAALSTLRLRSSRAQSDRKPAVEVQQCPLRAEVGEERRVGKAEVDVEVEAEVVEEKEEDEGEVEEKEEEEPEQLWQNLTTLTWQVGKNKFYRCVRRVL